MYLRVKSGVKSNRISGTYEIYRKFDPHRPYQQLLPSLVVIQGRSNIRMPQQFLVHLQIDSKRVKQCGMAMPERVPADSTDSQLLCSGDKPILPHSSRPIRFARLWISEDLILNVPA